MRKNYQATIKSAGKRTYLGTYDTAKEAAIAYDRAVLKANKSTTLLNFPDMVHNLDVEQKRTVRKLSSTGYRGVYKNGNSYQASIKISGKTTYIGTFDTAIEAARAYDQAAIKAGRHYSELNDPDLKAKLAFWKSDQAEVLPVTTQQKAVAKSSSSSSSDFSAKAAVIDHVFKSTSDNKSKKKQPRTDGAGAVSL